MGVLRNNQISFLVWNWPLLPNKAEAKAIRKIASQNFDETKNWYYLSVLLNLSPFIISLGVEFFWNKSNMLCLLNNGSIPILAYSLLATNFFYLLENVPDFTESKSFRNVKIRLYVLSILTMFCSAILYIFQSNFVNYFHYEQLNISLIFSWSVLVLAVLWGSKMYLLQQSKIMDYANLIASEQESLNRKNNSGYNE